MLPLLNVNGFELMYNYNNRNKLELKCVFDCMNQTIRA